MIEKQLPHEIMTANAFHTSLLFYATQIIIPFLDQRISDNHDNVEGHGKIL
jgi:hypothetical protein